MPYIAKADEMASDASLDLPKPFRQNVFELFKTNKPRFKDFDECVSSS